MSPRLPAMIPIEDAWSDSSLADWRRLADHAHALGERSSGIVLGNAREELRALLRAGDLAAVEARMASPAQVSALTALWGEPDGEFAGTISRWLLASIAARHPRLPRLAHANLLRLYFARFDELECIDRSPRENTDGDAGSGARSVFDALLDLVRRGPALQGDPPGESFGRQGPENLAAIIASDAGSPADSPILRNLARFRGGRFIDLLDNCVFLERVRALEPGASGAVLEELRDAALYCAPHRHGRLLGHAVLELMIDRAQLISPGELWRDFVLHIAGDPRLAHTARFEKWWRPLGPGRIAAVTAWLAQADVEAFLGVLGDIADSDEAMSRQFPRRKVFLEGLIRAGTVRRSRLILAEEVRGQVRRRYVAGQAPDSALLFGGGNRMRAMIYLDCGDFHLIEGSHNTKLFLSLGQPSPELTNSRVSSFTYDELTKDVRDRFRRRWAMLRPDSPAGAEEILHQGRWSGRAVVFLRTRGIGVDPQLLMGSADYRDLVYRGEIPRLSTKRIIPLSEGENNGNP